MHVDFPKESLLRRPRSLIDAVSQIGKLSQFYKFHRDRALHSKFKITDF